MVEPPRQDAVSYFDELAPSYSARYGSGGGLWHRHFFEGRRDIALGWLAEIRSGTVVDVGSGPGPLTRALGERGIDVLAVDRAPAMARAAAAGGVRAAVTADACRLPVRAAACAAAVALGLSSYVEDLPALLAELRRVVRPGGPIVVSVAVASAPDWLARRVLRRPAAALGVRGVLTSGVALRTRRRQAWRAAARAAGLDLVAERGHDFTLFPLSRLLPGPSVTLSRALETLDSRRLDPLASEVVLLLRVPGGPPPAPPVNRRPRIVRAIARLNVGGPALHTILATRGLAPAWTTTLATGRVGPGEIEATHLLERYDVTPQRIPGLGRAPQFTDDIRAFLGLLSLLRRVRPEIVHTHTAKAGALGRVAARLAGVPRVVHTFHGHVFHGYFGPVLSLLTIWVERLLAQRTDRVLAVSDEVARDLVERYRIAPRSAVEVIRVGLPLARLATLGRSDRRRARERLGIAANAPVAVMVGRLVPVKEPDVAIAAWAHVTRARPDAVLLVVGGGPLLAALRSAGPHPGVRLLGWRSDVAPLLAAADVALLTSRNEGTPVALIEASAAGLPSVATRVGGVPSVVLDGETGLLAERGDARALGAALLTLLGDPARAQEMGRAARVRALAGWSDDRLLRDLDALYRQLLTA